MRVAPMHHIRRAGKNEIIQVFVQVPPRLQNIVGKPALVASRTNLLTPSGSTILISGFIRGDTRSRPC
jgi:hypothetical protein